MSQDPPPPPSALHQDAVATLRAYDAPDPHQRRLALEYLAFLDAHDDATRRGCVPGHLTASALVLSHDHRQVLLTLHPRHGRWLQLGGHCEPQDPTLAAAALREAVEESGVPDLRILGGPVQLDRHRVGCHGGSWHYDVEYLAVAPEHAVIARSDESDDLRWFDRDALPAPTDPALGRLVALVGTRSDLS